MAKSQQKRVVEELTKSTTASNESSISVMRSPVEPLKLDQPELSDGEFGTLQEILFGKQMVFQSNQISSLHAHVEERLTALQQNCDEQFSELHHKLDQGLSRVNSQLEQANSNNDKVQGQLETQLNKASEQLTRSIHSSRDEIMQRLETAIADLDAQKLDKGALSSLLGDVATQLTGQVKN